MTSGGSPERRILAAFGETDKFAGFTAGDLKLFLPTLFAGLIIAGSTPDPLQPAGYVAGGGLIMTCLVIIYATPQYQTAPVWLRDRLQFLRRPRVLHRGGGTQSSAPQTDCHPSVEKEASTEATGAVGAIFARTGRGNTGSLTRLRRFLPRGVARRDDEYLFGAVEVTPANMALATDADWEHAVGGFAAAINGIDFHIQVYSTVRPVDPERITAGYRNRLNADAEMTEQFEQLVTTYAERLPQEFAQRGTGLRRYYVIIPVSPVDVQKTRSSVDQASLVGRLCDLPYIGGFVKTLSAFRQEESIEERRHRQRVELDRRLDAISQGLRRISGCSTRRLDTPALARLLDEFWSGSTAPDEPEMPAPRTAQFVTTDTEDSS